MTFEAPPLRDWRAMAARVTTFGPVTDVRLVETLSPCVAGIMGAPLTLSSVVARLDTKNALRRDGVRSGRGIFDPRKEPFATPLCSRRRTVGTFHTSSS